MTNLIRGDALDQATLGVLSPDPITQALLGFWRVQPFVPGVYCPPSIVVVALTPVFAMATYEPAITIKSSDLFLISFKLSDTQPIVSIVPVNPIYSLISCGDCKGPMNGQTYIKGCDIPFEVTFESPSDAIDMTGSVVSFVARTKAGSTISQLSTTANTLSIVSNTADRIVVGGVIPRTATNPSGKYVTINYGFTISVSGYQWAIADYEGEFYLKDPLFQVPQSEC